MSKITRIAVLAMSLLSLLAVMSSAAGAVTWTNTGQTTFTATSGGISFSSTNTTLGCGGAGDAVGTTRTPVSGVGASIAHGTISFTSCRVGGLTVPMHCTFTWTANTFVGGVTSGNIDLTCGVFVTNRENCHIEGRTGGTYTNGAAGVLAVPHSASLVITNGNGGGSCVLGSNDRLTLNPLSFRVTSGTGPVIATD